MKRIVIGIKRSRWLWIAVLSLAGVLALASQTLTASESEPQPKDVEAESINWWSVDSGGGEASGGDWAIVSAVGQHDAGALSGAPMTLDGGFVLPSAPDETPLFSDGFESGNLGAWNSATP